MKQICFSNLKKITFATIELNLNICFYKCFIYIVPEDQNTEGTVDFKIKISDQGYLNTSLLTGDGTLSPHYSKWRSRTPNIGVTQR